MLRIASRAISHSFTSVALPQLSSPVQPCPALSSPVQPCPALSSPVPPHHCLTLLQVAAEALRVCEALVGVLRPDPTKPVPPEQAALVMPLYSAIMARLRWDTGARVTAGLAWKVECRRRIECCDCD